MESDPGREEILWSVRSALKRRADEPVPDTVKFAHRTPGDADAEMELLLAEIGKLTGVTRRITGKDIKPALEELVKAEEIKKATIWDTAGLRDLGIARTLAALGVEIVSPQADKYRVAECDLGVTTVDAALPETGTLLLRSSPERPRVVSLLPRVHLAILRPAALRAELGQALAEVKGEGYFVLITGPSRTADIELVTTIGVHGPKALHVWALDG